MFVVMDGRREIKRFFLLAEAFQHATKLVLEQPLTRKTARELARTSTYNIVEV